MQESKTGLPQSRKTVGILQPGYLPWLGFFEQVYRSDVFVLYDDVQFEKGSWRNRNRIKGAAGPIWLTVPVLLKGKTFPLIKDIKINSSVQWQKKHIRAITLNYAKSPFFGKYSESLFEIIDRPWKYLMDVDLALLYWLFEHLNLHKPIRLSSEIGIGGSRVQRLIDIILSLGGNCFYEGAAGKNYISVDTFEDAGIAVIFQQYEHPVYPQLYGTFVSHLSIIDLLFNCGPDSLGILISNMKGGCA